MLLLGSIAYGLYALGGPERSNLSCSAAAPPAAPPQAQYESNPDIQAARRLLAQRWHTSPNTLLILVLRPASSSADYGELGIVNATSCASARLWIAEAARPALQRYAHQSVPSGNTVYLVDEFIPETAGQVRMARSFYASPLPSGSYGVIMLSAVDLSGEGNIAVLAQDMGYLHYPVEHFIANKQQGLFLN